MIQLDTRSENHVCITNTTEKSALVIEQDEDFHLYVFKEVYMARKHSYKCKKKNRQSY